VSGEEDRATSGCRRRPLSTALRATRDVIVDMSELSFADSSLMIGLACLAQRLRARGRTLLLRHPQPHVRRLIALMGLDGLPSVLVIVPEVAGVPAAT
jgi:anti-anti-sigma factor